MATYVICYRYLWACLKFEQIGATTDLMIKKIQFWNGNDEKAIYHYDCQLFLHLICFVGNVESKLWAEFPVMNLIIYRIVILLNYYFPMKYYSILWSLQLFHAGSDLKLESCWPRLQTKVTSAWKSMVITEGPLRLKEWQDFHYRIFKPFSL